PADGAKRRGAGLGRAWPPLVVIAMAHHPHSIALFECIMQQPFKRSPRRMYLYAPFEAPVVGEPKVSIASADIRDHHTVLTVERAEQVACRGAFRVRLAVAIK